MSGSEQRKGNLVRVPRQNERFERRKSSTRPGIRFFDGLLRNDKEELEMAETVHPLVTMPPVVDFHGSAFRQPNAEPGPSELDRGIRDVKMLHLQLDLRNGRD